MTEESFSISGPPRMVDHFNLDRWYLVTPIRLDGPLPCELIRGVILRLATNDEIEETSQTLRLQRGEIGANAVFLPSSRVAMFADVADGGGFRRIRRLQTISALTEVDLFFGVGLSTPSGTTSISGAPGVGLWPTHPGFGWSTIKTLTEATRSQLRFLDERIDGVFDQYPEIAAAVSILRTALDVSADSPLRTIGMFAAIEALLTHKSVRGVSQSLTHQIRYKMRLLQRRMAPPIDYSCFGQGDQTDRWIDLYNYRSEIAHGGELDFEDDKKQLRLKSPQIAADFVVSAAKAVVRHAISEPDLVLDLQRC